MNETSPQTTGLFELLMARIRALEADFANLRDEVAELHALLADADAGGWLGGTE